MELLDKSGGNVFKLTTNFAVITHFRGTAENTKGTAFVVFDEKDDAVKAFEKLSGFQVSGR